MILAKFQGQITAAVLTENQHHASKKALGGFAETKTAKPTAYQSCVKALVLGQSLSQVDKGDPFELDSVYPYLMFKEKIFLILYLFMKN